MTPLPYRARVHRPEFERLLEDVAWGALDMVAVFKIDRLLRRPADFEPFWDEAESRGTNTASVTDASNIWSRWRSDTSAGGLFAR